MGRWKLGIQQHLLVARMSSFLKIASIVLPPRIRAAVFNTWWNRTCTSRRFQRQATCPLCHAGQDEVEHWPKCAVIRWWATELLDLPVHILHGNHRGEHTALAELFGLGSGTLTRTRVFNIGALLYLAENTHNALRHGADLDFRDTRTRREHGNELLGKAIADFKDTYDTNDPLLKKKKQKQLKNTKVPSARPTANRSRAEWDDRYATA